MSENNANQAQIDFWTSAGPTWTELRERFDQQAGEHGRAAIEALQPEAGERIVDVGCGAGTSTLQLADLVGPTGMITGVDLSPTMIEGAVALAEQQQCANVQFAVADAMVDDVGVDVDGLYSRFGVMFFADPTAAFTNLRRALRTDGRLSFVCWKSPTENEWASLPLSIAGKYVDVPFGADPTAPGPFSFADPGRVSGILTDAGFVDVELTARATPVRLGSDLDDAISFLLGLNPAARALAEAEPARFDELHSEVCEATADWATDTGVEAPSAVWITTAKNPG